MGHRVFVLAALALAFLALGGLGVYAWDAGARDEIADGVSVGGVDLGGLDADKAAGALRVRLAAPAREPIVASAGRHSFVLDPARLGLRVDIGGMVDAALEKSREGGLPGRLWRAVTGASVEASLRPRVSYPERALRRFVERVRGRLDRPARDASVRASGSGITKVPSATGRRVGGKRLREALAGVLTHPGRAREVRIPVAITRPRLTTKELARRYPYYITVDRGAFRLHFYRRLERVRTYVIAVGQVGFDTPAGLYHIQNKAIDPAWSVPNRAWAGELAGRVIPGGSPENPIKARWMGIYDGAGIHGTDETATLGSAASHGCIRMAIPEVEELYEQVPVRTPVYIG
jgi:lipoprotein-anchoring transpeptidase ErfK/SrfK